MVDLPNGVEIQKLINNLRILSWEVSDILLYYSNRINNSKCNEKLINYKNQHEPVTIADLKVNELITKSISESYSEIGWGFLSEESDELFFLNDKSHNDWIWVLDPLDGTKDFIQGTGNFAMHLALNYKNSPIIGVVLIPNRDELWISNGDDTWCENRKGTKMKPNLSDFTNVSEMRIVMSQNHQNINLLTLIEKLNFKDSICMGSIGCKIASILRGESDIYISFNLPGKSSPKDWDLAAPEAILKKAGGSITNLENEELVYNKINCNQGGVIIASNNLENHQNTCKMIKKVILKYNLYSEIS
tara:strand:+ start:733 stop:1641 length:909 start_codon:yes stop_codon:yes gene_type:complete